MLILSTRNYSVRFNKPKMVVDSDSYPVLPVRLDPLLKLTCSRVFKPANMLEDEDFQLCLDMDKYAIKARKEEMREEPAIQRSREAEAAEKRKIEDVEADGAHTGEIANGVSSAKKAKLSASSAPGAWTSHPLSVQEASYPAPTLSSSIPEATVSISTSTGDAGTVVQNEVPSHHPDAHTLKDTTFKVPEVRTSHRRSLHGRGRMHFPIYEDPQTKQDFFEKIYQWDTIGYRTPGEDKENSDESFVHANSDVEMGGTTDDEEEDRDLEMGEAGELEGEGEDSGSDVSAGTADPMVYAGSLLEPPWTTNRGQPLGLVREGRAFNVS